ncbi:hypothetical protein GGX14DRAFT_645613 [Mycena pura]|uniref:Uncharacterized protein n=1 Tax=Mycena pura TaxID=153505 RepID=A0AAD6YA54_9AGAR|nr:hypothetical protein GGX14DRAFT_645613 [Mycena pura]
MRSLSSVLQLDPFDTRHLLVTSPFLRPSALAAVRLVIACYTLATLAFSIFWGITVTRDAAGYFSYFTHLCYCGLCGYFFAAGLQTAVYAARGERGYLLQGWAKLWRFLHLALLSTVTTFPFLVSIVYWALLANASTFDSRFNAWSAISVHLLNSVFALFEIGLTNTCAPSWLFLPLGLLLLLGYVGVVYITHAAQGFYPYPFMAPNGHPLKLALHLLGIALAECVIFAAVYGLVVLRQRLTPIDMGHFPDERGSSEAPNRPPIQNSC